MSASKNRLTNPSFTYVDAAMPIAAFTDSALVQTARNWFVESVKDGGTAIALTASVAAFPLTQVALPGEPKNYLQLAITSAGANLGSNSFLKLCTRLAPQVLNGLYATFSFWMNSNVPTRPVVMVMRRSYGTGGTPSPDDVFPITVPKILAVGGWQRFALSAPFIPIVDGLNPRVFGTDNNGYVELALYLQAGSNVPIAGGGFVGPAANVLQFAQPQLEAGTLATPWVDGDPDTLRTDGSGDPQLWDPVVSKWRTATAPDGVLTLGDPVP